MMKIFLYIFTAITLTACLMAQESPTKNMTAEQISYLSDDRLCDLQAHSKFEPKLEVEIGKRDIECTKEFLACKRQGYEPKTPKFQNCKDFESMKNITTDVVGDVMRSLK